MFPKLMCLSAFVCAAAAFAQNSPQPEVTADPAKAPKDPAAYIYVTTTPPHSSVNEIVGYTADAKGHLSPLPGSPFTAEVTSMAVNGRYLFAANTNGIDVNTYAIEANGALTFVNQTDVARYNWRQCGSSGALFTDRTGNTLYDMEFDGNSCSNNKYESLGPESNGGLKNLGSGVASSWLTLPASFIGDNKFAYSVSCLGDMYWTIFGMERKSTGELSLLGNFAAPLPAPKAGDFYCPSQVATDPANHVAIALQPVNGQQFMPDGGPQIGAFTAAGNGDLSTTNTSANMPVSAVGTALSLSMAPSGKLLAVGGSGGLQIFHFRGAAPPVAATGLLTTDEIDQMFWDKHNHLYAISTPKGLLYVYTITATRYLEAPGSPYAVSAPMNLAVQTLP